MCLILQLVFISYIKSRPKSEKLEFVRKINCTVGPITEVRNQEITLRKPMVNEHQKTKKDGLD